MYGDLVNWRAWATARGDNSPTAASDQDATAALVRASDYIKFNYVAHFARPHDENSDGVEEATYVAAGIELSNPNFFSQTYTPSQQKVLTGVGQLKWTPVEEKRSNSDTSLSSPKSTMIEGMLARYVASDVGFSIKAIGA